MFSAMPTPSFVWRRSDLSGSWEAHRERAVLFDPAESIDPRRHGSIDAAFRCLNHVGLGISLFRGSIARPDHSLSTLRSRSYLRTTQDSLAICWL